MEKDLNHLIEGCRQQDRASQKRLYRHFYAYGMSICIRYAENENGAITILNDAFMKVFSRIHKYHPDKPFKPWLRAVIVNTAIDDVKKRNRLMKRESLKEANEVADREDILSRIGYAELLEMVRSLSTAYRTVFNLYAIDGYKHEEIAQRLGISVGTSKSNLSKARAHLRTKVKQSLQLKDYHA